MLKSVKIEIMALFTYRLMVVITTGVGLAQRVVVG